jgi:4-hydroxy-3-methylbut-2-enyl diphosphate reductase
LSPASPLVVAAPLRVEARAVRRGSPGVRVLRTGMGPERSRRAVGALRGDPAPAVAVAGLCGALAEDLEPGDVVVASRLLRAGAEEIRLETRPLVDALRALGFAPRVGPLVSVDHLVRGAEREELAGVGALAVDMETAWLAEGAGDRPLAVVRVVVDAPRFELLRAAALLDGVRALRRLRAAAPALARWAAALSGTTRH